MQRERKGNRNIFNARVVVGLRGENNRLDCVLDTWLRVVGD